VIESPPAAVIATSTQKTHWRRSGAVPGPTVMLNRYQRRIDGE
jgi:hypothetical protein